ncbi:MAG: sugar transferase, partial [Duncaniella sp.]|nr:sugar transferase [Duncaniella sp.]
HMLKHTSDYSKLIRAYMVRHLIKPGITGWAQVRGFRGQTEELWQMERRVEHDIWYIEHWSFLLDIKIIFRTIINAFKKDEQAF